MAYLLIILCNVFLKMNYVFILCQSIGHQHQLSFSDEIICPGALVGCDLLSDPIITCLMHSSLFIQAFSFCIVIIMFSPYHEKMIHHLELMMIHFTLKEDVFHNQFTESLDDFHLPL